jgi:hypothetical protein
MTLFVTDNLDSHLVPTPRPVTQFRRFPNDAEPALAQFSTEHVPGDLEPFLVTVDERDSESTVD